jgi:hypothetical protein
MLVTNKRDSIHLPGDGWLGNTLCMALELDIRLRRFDLGVGRHMNDGRHWNEK